MKKLSEEDTINGASMEKLSTKRKVIVAKMGNWGKDTNLRLLEKNVQFGT